MAGNEASRERTARGMELRATEQRAAWLLMGRSILASSTRRAMGSISRRWADRKSKARMGLETAAKMKESKKVRSPQVRRRLTVPQDRIYFLSAPDSPGPEGGAEERWGRRLTAASVSTRNCCFVSSSCKKIRPPRVLISWRQTSFPPARCSWVCSSSPSCPTRRGTSRNRLCHRGGPASERGPGSGGWVTGDGLLRSGGRRPAPVFDSANRSGLQDGGDGFGPGARVDPVRVLRHLPAVDEVFGHDVVSHVHGHAHQEEGHESCAGHVTVG